MNAGFGIWIVNDAAWLRTTDSDRGGAMVHRTLLGAADEAERLGVMDDLGPCEARPFDWDQEVQP